MKNITLLLLATLLCLVSSCKKDDNPDNPYGLPDATQTGENTFGCLINGEPWVAEVSTLSLLHDVSATYDEVGIGADDQFYFWVDANKITSTADSSKIESLLINLQPIYDEGELDFSSLFRQNATFYSELYNVSNSLRVYELDTMYNTNYFKITTLDTMSNICAAEFNLQLIRSTNLTDTIFVTEGRFDVKYQPE